MNFKEALTTHDTFTENAMPTHSTSGDFVLDLFFRLGASRNLSHEEILQSFHAAFGQDKLKTMKVVFYNRDVRAGQGERRSFRIIYKHLCENYPEIAVKNLELIPKYGRWDDLLVCAYATSKEYIAYSIIKEALERKDGLCAKWMPRENKSGRLYALRLMRYLGLNPKTYRKRLSELTKVVENKMCKQQWENIDYNHVPSRASFIYRKAFKKHDEIRYSKWLDSLQDKNSGNKIHADTIFPHDILRPYLNYNSPDIILDKTLEKYDDVRV